MPAITLPDGSSRQFDAPVTGTAGGRGDRPGPRQGRPRHARRRPADRPRPPDRGRCRGRLRHPARCRRAGADPARRRACAGRGGAVALPRHPGHHRPVTIENGFYYDFARNEPFTPADFPAIEARMREIIAANAAFERQVMGPRRGDRVLRGPRRTLQGRADPRPARPARRSRSTSRATGSTSAAARICAAPATSAAPSSCSASPAPIGAATTATPCSAASTPPPGATRRSWTPICTSSRKPSAATTAASAARWTCSTSRRRRSAASSGTRMAGGSTAPSRPICAAAWMPPATRRCAPRKWSTARCGSAPAIGRSSARTCSSPRSSTSRTVCWR